MWTVADATSTLATAYSGTGDALTYIVGVIVGAIVALLALGFGIRHLRKYVTGRKF